MAIPKKDPPVRQSEHGVPKKINIATMNPPGAKLFESQANAVNPAEQGRAAKLLIEPDVNVDSAPLKSVKSTSGQVISVNQEGTPSGIAKELKLVFFDGHVYLLIEQGWHWIGVPLNSKRGRYALRVQSERAGKLISKTELNDRLEQLEGSAEEYAPRKQIYHRVAPTVSGVEIYLSDPNFNRLRVSAEGVTVMEVGSDTLFRVSPVMRVLPMPAEKGDFKRLKPILNIPDLEFILGVAWLTYTIATPKIEGSKYVHLVVSGDQGTGKSSLCNILLRLIDPSLVGIQAMPSKAEELALILQNSHIACFDNVRYFNSAMSDYLCMASTGGAISNRALYTDSDVSVKRLHGACIFNGIYSFISQPDLAQRCLTIRTRKIEHQQRRTESQLMQQFEAEQPVIFRGLLDLISNIYKHLPTVTVERPERMVEFSYWLAAMEKAQDAPEGVYQSAYSENLKQTQLNNLMENTLAAALVEFSEELRDSKWAGSPAELLEELDMAATRSTMYSRAWPKSPIALGKRIQGLKAALSEQGIHIESSRGKKRVITITVER